jgi:hypothetical protein
VGDNFLISLLARKFTPHGDGMRDCTANRAGIPAEILTVAFSGYNLSRSLHRPVQIMASEGHCEVTVPLNMHAANFPNTTQNRWV